MPEQIWPWLVQMGGEHGGWYSYDLLDDDGIPSARIADELRSVPGSASVTIDQWLPPRPVG